MKIVSCYNGMEDVVAREVNGKKVCAGRVSFHDAEEIKTGINVYELISSFNFRKLDDLLKKAGMVEIGGDEAYSVDCEREGIHDFKSVTAAAEIAKALRKSGLNVDHKNYDRTLFVDIVDDKCFIGILIGKNINKREYRVRRHNRGLDCSLAHCMLKLLDFRNGEVLYDCNCMDGVIGVEASLEGLKVYCHGKENDVRNAKINAKMAKAEITFEKTDKCDYLASYFVSPSIRVSEKAARRSLEELKKIKFKKAVLISHSRWLKDNLKEHKLEEREVKRKNSKFFVYLVHA